MKGDAGAVGRDLAELNDGFLRLVSRDASAGLPDTVRARLRVLEQDAQARLAAMPFALFGFGFEDEDAWARLLSPGVRELEPRGQLPLPPVERFTLLALTSIRGLLRADPRSVLNWIGLPPGTGGRLAALEIGSLGLVATLASHRLRGRLAPREVLWLRLIAAAQERDTRQLALLAALGRQWTIRRSLGLAAPSRTPRGHRRAD
jgi:hypothetical protein